MVKISELETAEEVHAEDMQDPEYRREYERTRLASDVAIRVIQYRVKHGLSQTDLAKRLGMRQPNASRTGLRRPAPDTDARTPGRKTPRGGSRILTPAAHSS
jgi:ribosome-binding protein aMBF1 (putative translation factor)